MNSIVKLAENEEKSEFYPTPEKLVKKMIEGIDWRMIETILEPSAGKGDILRIIAKIENVHSRNFDVDCIEIDQNLRQVLKYNFGSREDDLRAEAKKIKDKYKYCESRYREGWTYYNGEKYVPVPDDDKEKLDEFYEEINNYFFENGIHLICDDFLKYNPYKQYDLIVMNPPFSNGDKHLLKALDIQKKGGNIVCLLNAETIRNPYTETRKELVKKLREYNAQIEYISDSFTNAERKTGVEIALIKVSIEKVQEESDIFNRFKEAEEVEDFNYTATELEVTDYIKAAVNQFNVEVKSGLELIRQYKAMIPYMAVSFGEDTYDKKPILRLTDSYDRSYDSVSVNSYLKAVRLKYWRTLLKNPKFVGKLTSKLQDEWYRKVESLANYDFSEFNIYNLVADMNMQIKTGIEDEIVAMFDRLTEEHSWYPECSKNRHYYDGWKTNKAHKIDKKVIIPSYGVFSGWNGEPRVYEANKVLEDIERILNFLDGGMTRNVELWYSIESSFKRGITKNIETKFFNVTFYKKGTIHITFTCPELIERFNIYAAQKKSWLPPCYGKKSYNDMEAEEKAVIDSFQGEQAYEEILSKANYYLAPVTTSSNILLIVV